MVGVHPLQLDIVSQQQSLLEKLQSDLLWSLIEALLIFLWTCIIPL